MCLTKIERLENLNARQEEIIGTMAEQKADMLAIMLEVAGYLVENRKSLSKDGTPTSIEVKLNIELTKLGAEVPL